jgi:hypothetical protein
MILAWIPQPARGDPVDRPIQREMSRNLSMVVLPVQVAQLRVSTLVRPVQVLLPVAEAIPRAVTLVLSTPASNSPFVFVNQPSSIFQSPHFPAIGSPFFIRSYP